MDTSYGQGILALEKKPFATALSGPRVQLVRSGPRYAQQIWECIQRDRLHGGSIYSWVTSFEDVTKYIAIESAVDAREIAFETLLSLERSFANQ